MKVHVSFCFGWIQLLLLLSNLGANVRLKVRVQWWWQWWWWIQCVHSLVPLFHFPSQCPMQMMRAKRGQARLDTQSASQSVIHLLLLPWTWPPENKRKRKTEREREKGIPFGARYRDHNGLFSLSFSLLEPVFWEPAYSLAFFCFFPLFLHFSIWASFIFIFCSSSSLS